jgi:1,4-dihydroxy-2-naphthoate octaprenyltransferase
MASLPVGFLIMAVLYINQFPDFEADRAVGKRHWVVRLGTRRALPGLAVLLLAPYPAVALAVAVGLAPWTALACLLTVPLALRAFRVALLHHDAPVALRPANAMVIGTHLLTGLLLTGGYLAGALLGRGS